MCAPSFEHWIVVDRGDLPLFRSLQSRRTTVLAKEEVLPVWLHRIDTLKIGLRSNVWIQAGGRPIRGWLLQQLVKLAVTEHLRTDVVMHADSDVVLLQPFSVPSVVDEGGRVRLYARPGYVDQGLPGHLRWHRSAEKLLGLDPAGLPMPDFISSLVPWRRENAVRLLEHVERTTGRHWLRALAAAWDVSEYTLYGRFARDVLGESGAQFVSKAPLCVDYYKHIPLTVRELTTFLERMNEEAIAISLTSKAGMRPEDYVKVLEQKWAPPIPERADDDPAVEPRAPHFAAESAGQRSRGPGHTRTPARKAPVGRAGSGSGQRRPARLPIRFRTRSGLAAVAGIVIVLMIVLLRVGMD